MRVFRFREESSRSVAFTKDGRGARLPQDGRVWQAMGPAHLDQMDLAAIGTTGPDVKRALLAQGYFICPAAPCVEV